jgi:hypothetical protein
MATPTTRPTDLAISRLQGDAWAAWNASYHAEERDLYRDVSRALYNQDVQERIRTLFARSDAQNTLLDALLADHTKSN